MSFAVHPLILVSIYAISLYDYLLMERFDTTYVYLSTCPGWVDGMGMDSIYCYLPHLSYLSQFTLPDIAIYSSGWVAGTGLG